MNNQEYWVQLHQKGSKTLLIGKGAPDGLSEGTTLHSTTTKAHDHQTVGHHPTAPPRSHHLPLAKQGFYSNAYDRCASGTSNVYFFTCSAFDWLGSDADTSNEMLQRAIKRIDQLELAAKELIWVKMLWALAVHWNVQQAPYP